MKIAEKIISMFEGDKKTSGIRAQITKLQRSMKGTGQVIKGTGFYSDDKDKAKKVLDLRIKVASINLADAKEKSDAEGVKYQQEHIKKYQDHLKAVSKA
jgi:hypothetical protein